MNRIIESLSSAALGPALEANMVEFWSAYGRAPQRELYEGPDLIRFVTGVPFPLFNGVFRARLTPDTVDAAIGETLARGASRGAPLFWWIGPDTQPSDLGAYLERHGFIHAGDTPGMAVDLLALNEDQPAPANLTIKHVEDLETLKIWARVVAAGSGAPEPIHEALIDLEVGVGIAPNGSRRRYIGYQNGAPVAAAALVLNGGVAGIFAVATLPEARRQGIGAALTLAPLREACAAGYRVGTLQASEMGFPVYRRLGFQEVCTFGLYLWPGVMHPSGETTHGG